jgi:ABC-2 type transport system ATP-binding protein
VGEEPERVKQAIGVLPEGLNLYQRLTAREHVQFVGAMYGLAPDVAAARSEELLDLMDLEADADKLIVDYSQGMRKKTALAAALIHAPRVLFLDEPFEGIDAITVRAIRTVLQRLASRGTTIFFSSHILDVVERLCTRVAVIASGRLVAEGSIETLRHQAKAGAHATLEEIFMQAVGAESEEATQRGLSWLD